ncbi:ABC transporter permease [Mucilaginibacter sp. E4BP6]|uniref:ABC transporter permease n=1 Tax=Mucilaginibacter sp. E4BP6 TaxID=2723089 RepID=UPI0015CD4591|nr:FtsX-like permease family protein [Mucilaginibacter sp. E4BP6]NYE68326.1 lipoprotein-releasing system permease protein [Mucilaginibacter sp. E4BP6]
MNTSVYIAKRYLFSRKKMHAINIISGISMLGVFVGSAALVIILSVFNGFEKVILGLYSNFTPELKIEPRFGKAFDPNTTYFMQLHKDPRVFSYTQVLQEKALIMYNNKSFIGNIKGVTADFLKNKQLDSTIQDGSFTLQSDSMNYAVIGGTVAGSLSVNLSDPTPLRIYAPNRTAMSSSDPLNEFIVRNISPSGVFSIQQDFDDIAVTPISFARELLNEPVDVSSIEINCVKGTDVDAFQREIIDRAGGKYTVKNRIQQNTELYKTLNYERWFIFMILVFVLIIAIFNIIGSLTMLVIDKRKDIAILSSLGAGKKLVQGIFFFEGMMISGIGCIAGMVVGLIFCMLQQKYGFIKMGASMSVIDAYPIELRLKDFGLVLLTVGFIAVMASWISSRLSIKNLDDIKGDL